MTTIYSFPLVHRITSMNVNGHHMVRFFPVFFIFLFIYYLLFALLQPFILLILIIQCFCQVIPSMVVRSLKKLVSVSRSGFLTLEVTLDYRDDDIYVCTPCSYCIGLGGRMVFKKEGFSDFLQALSMEVTSLVLITQKERDWNLVVIFSLLPR